MHIVTTELTLLYWEGDFELAKAIMRTVRIFNAMDSLDSFPMSLTS